MSVNDPIGDMLTRIRNAQERGKSKVSTPHSKLRENVLNVLQGEGFIRGFAVVQLGNNKAEIEVELKYFDGAPVIRELQRVSKPGRRVYSGIKDLPKVYGGLGIAILSTSRGLMKDADCRRNKAGGELLCNIW